MLAWSQPLLRPLPSRIEPVIAACNASHATQTLLKLAGITSITRNESLAASYAASGLQWPNLAEKNQSYWCPECGKVYFECKEVYPFWFNARREKLTMIKDEGFVKDDTAASRNSLQVPEQRRE
jgi:hypothetical protein